MPHSTRRYGAYKCRPRLGAESHRNHTIELQFDGWGGRGSRGRTSFLVGRLLKNAGHGPGTGTTRLPVGLLASRRFHRQRANPVADRWYRCQARAISRRLMRCECPWIRHAKPGNALPKPSSPPESTRWPVSLPPASSDPAIPHPVEFHACFFSGGEPEIYICT